uniref:Gamma-tubulin complex component n=1 Tax=Rhizophora mucronata TaxID=61149 RepID=A0A2P2M765_RHIMU
MPSAEFRMDSCNIVFSSKSSSKVSPLSSLLKSTVKKCCSRSPEPSKYMRRKTASSSISLQSFINFNSTTLPIEST